MKGRLGLLFLLVVLLISFNAGGAWAAISGTVAYSGSKTGRIYLSVQGDGGWDTGFGVSIAGPGAFQINGVPTGTNYTVKAFMDTQGTAIHHANDPAGVSNSFNVSSGSGSTGPITLSNPSSVGAQAPQVMAYQGTGGNFVGWKGPSDNNGLTIADTYTVSWSANSSGVPVAGSKVVASGDKDFFAHVGGTASLYYQVTAVAGATTASSAWTQVTAVSGTTVNVTVNFPGVTATGPLCVALVDESTNPPKFIVLGKTSPVSGTTYAINNVPAGTYGVHPFLDQNNSGTFDVGDVGNLDNDFAPTVTVSSSPVSVPAMTLTAMNAITALTTQHSKDAFLNEGYNINLKVAFMKKQPVNVQITSGPQITAPADVAFGAWGNSNFQTSFNVGRPTVGDTYQVKLTYSDTTSETVSPSVTAVLDGFATPQAPVGYIPYIAAPTFTWTAPSPAPAQYIYSMWINQSNGGSFWEAWGLPSSQTSILYNSNGKSDQSALADGTTYNWSVTVTDINGNQAQNSVSFTPTSHPGINGFSPIGGPAGTSVTITGVNFSPTPTSNTVLFNGVTATVTAATSTTLTVTVPNGATTGLIQVNVGFDTAQSAKNFIVASPIHISGVIQTSAGVAIGGARVEKSDDPTIYTTTAGDGSYTLNWLFPNQWVSLKISKSGYVPTYTTNYWLNGNLDLTPYPSHLYTQAELAGWGVTAGKGVIAGEVLNTGTTPFLPVGNAVVTAQSSQNYPTYYPVTYYSGTSFGGASTYGNGFFFVLNVNDNDSVNVNASKSSWNFQNSGFPVHANSVTEGGIFGNTYPPYFSDFSPASGKAGTSVTINGGNFSSVPAENTVNFNGTPATVTAAGTSSLTVTVPAGATTGPISVTTAGGSASSSSNFTVQYTLTAAIAGTGGGSVLVSPPGTYLPTTPILYDYNSPVTLTAVPDSNSTLGWSGCNSASGNTCNVTMTADKSVTATFTYVAAVRLNGVDKPDLQTAFNQATNGGVIKARAHDFNESSLNLNNPVAFSLQGGYDLAYTNPVDYSNLHGILSIIQGTLTINNFVVQ